jgi:hypothetical protein
LNTIQDDVVKVRKRKREESDEEVSSSDDVDGLDVKIYTDFTIVPNTSYESAMIAAFSGQVKLIKQIPKVAMAKFHEAFNTILLDIINNPYHLNGLFKFIMLPRLCLRKYTAKEKTAKEYWIKQGQLVLERLKLFLQGDEGVRSLFEDLVCAKVETFQRKELDESDIRKLVIKLTEDGEFNKTIDVWTRKNHENKVNNNIFEAIKEKFPQNSDRITQKKSKASITASKEMIWKAIINQKRNTTAGRDG